MFPEKKTHHHCEREFDLSAEKWGNPSFVPRHLYSLSSLFIGGRNLQIFIAYFHIRGRGKKATGIKEKEFLLTMMGGYFVLPPFLLHGVYSRKACVGKKRNRV